MCNLCTTFSINLYVSFALHCLCLVFFLPLGWVVFPLSVDLVRRPPQCLNSRPGLEPGIHKGLGALFWGYASDHLFFPFLFYCVLDLFPFIWLKARRTWSPTHHVVDLLEIIREGVCVEHFFRPFGEISKGKLTIILTSPDLSSSTTLLFVRGFLVHQWHDNT